MANELLQNWRGRRLAACRLTDEIELVINALGKVDGSELPPDSGLPQISEVHRNELRNLSSLLLRMILAANDGHVSSSKLQRW